VSCKDELTIEAADALCRDDPASLEFRARARLALDRDDVTALFALGLALLNQGLCRQALGFLERAARLHPDRAEVHFYLGLAYAAVAMHSQSVAALRRALELDPAMAQAWRVLSEELYALGDNVGSEAAAQRASIAAIHDPRFKAALARAGESPRPDLEDAALSYLEEAPDDADALNLLAELALPERAIDAAALLERCLEIAPAHETGRRNFALSLLMTGETARAVAICESLLERRPSNPIWRKLLGEALLADGQAEKSLEVHDTLARDCPDQPFAHLGKALSLQALRRRRECEETFRQMIRRFQGFAPAYWGLASLRTVRFAPDEAAAMEAQLRRPDLAEDDRVMLLFARGRSLEQAGSFAPSFECYARANALKRASIDYDPQALAKHVERCRFLFAREFFEARAGLGCPADAPIFIVGLPRSGSSLIEQILSRHSAVEALGELRELASLARELRIERQVGGYLEALPSLGAREIAELGRRYAERVGARRKLGRPRVIDKAPRNFCETGLIRLILPRAKIIDARRGALACCFSNFTQLYAQGQFFSYSLSDLGRYYRDYADLMRHFDEVQPGAVHRVSYERLVENFEDEVRRLLDYLELPFEEDCLRFHEGARQVRTPSAEQVHSPIYADAVDHWKAYEPWLGPLKEALGPQLCEA
jgi:tetratricopeptide (TPR) repeat protein